MPKPGRYRSGSVSSGIVSAGFSQLMARLQGRTLHTYVYNIWCKWLRALVHKNTATKHEDTQTHVFTHKHQYTGMECKCKNIPTLLANGCFWVSIEIYETIKYFYPGETWIPIKAIWWQFCNVPKNIIAYIYQGVCWNIKPRWEQAETSNFLNFFKISFIQIIPEKLTLFLEKIEKHTFRENRYNHGCTLNREGQGWEYYTPCFVWFLSYKNLILGYNKIWQLCCRSTYEHFSVA